MCGTLKNPHCSMAVCAEHRSKFATLHRLWWHFHMSEKFSRGRKTLNKRKRKCLNKWWKYCPFLIYWQAVRYSKLSVICEFWIFIWGKRSTSTVLYRNILVHLVSHESTLHNHWQCKFQSSHVDINNTLMKYDLNKSDTYSFQHFTTLLELKTSLDNHVYSPVQKQNLECNIFDLLFIFKMCRYQWKYVAICNDIRR